MAALIQTGTLVNGEWITTAVDLSTVLERNKEQKEEESDEEVEIIPALGVMSQTVVESPVIRWIIPARIRSGSFNDCVFIGVSPSHFLSSLRSNASHYNGTHSPWSSPITRDAYISQLAAPSCQEDIPTCCCPRAIQCL
jgi:hypothetical protein